jgi:hypothetical protein
MVATMWIGKQTTSTIDLRNSSEGGQNVIAAERLPMSTRNASTSGTRNSNDTPTNAARAKSVSKLMQNTFIRRFGETFAGALKRIIQLS